MQVVVTARHHLHLLLRFGKLLRAVRYSILLLLPRLLLHLPPLLGPQGGPVLGSPVPDRLPRRNRFRLLLDRTASRLAGGVDVLVPVLLPAVLLLVVNGDLSRLQGKRFENLTWDF